MKIFQDSLKWVIFLALLTTGASSMIYEVVAIRELSIIFGATEIAASATLALFLGGLAIGSRWLGAFADKCKDLFGLFIILQLGIAGCSLYLYPALGIVEQAKIPVLQFTLVSIFLLIPTILMGGELPLASKIAIVNKGPDKAGEYIGHAYAADTIGGVCGAVIAGLVLIPLLGSYKSILFGGFLNLLSSLVIFFYWRGSLKLHQSKTLSAL